jgi:hypothetical protein
MGRRFETGGGSDGGIGRRFGFGGGSDGGIGRRFGFGGGPDGGTGRRFGPGGSDGGTGGGSDRGIPFNPIAMRTAKRRHLSQNGYGHRSCCAGHTRLSDPQSGFVRNCFV